VISRFSAAALPSQCALSCAGILASYDCPIANLRTPHAAHRDVGCSQISEVQEPQAASAVRSMYESYSADATRLRPLPFLFERLDPEKPAQDCVLAFQHDPYPTANRCVPYQRPLLCLAGTLIFHRVVWAWGRRLVSLPYTDGFFLRMCFIATLIMRPNSLSFLRLSE
jgi:hypothetical protein